MSEEIHTDANVQQPGNSTELVAARTPPDPVIARESASYDLVVFGKDTEAILAGQTAMIEWVDRKLADERAEQTDMAQNLLQSIQRGWRTEGWERRVAKQKKRVTYYEKIKAALEAGYVIMPAIQMDVFAVRTSKRRPPGKEHRGWATLDAKPDNSPVGEGAYVDRRVEIASRTVERALGDGRTTTDEYRRAVAFDEEIDFPLAMAKPQVLDASGKALALKIFDEVGVLPRSRRGDPMVIGRVVLNDGPRSKDCSFLICWYVDTRAL